MIHPKCKSKNMGIGIVMIDKFLVAQPDQVTFQLLQSSAVIPGVLVFPLGPLLSVFVFDAVL